MTDQQVYEMQNALRDAEMLLDDEAREYAEMARAGALVGTQDYWDGPLGRKVRALREQVAAAQAEIGGVVYKVPVENLGALRADLDKLVKRAAKLGVGEVSYRVGERIEAPVSKLDPMIAQAEMGYIPRYAKAHRLVVLNAGVVKLAGWMLLATLTVEPGGVMISRVPGFARAWALHRETGSDAPATDFDEVATAAQEALDSVILTAYRDEKRATTCDHCGLSRRRTKTYLVEHAETREIKQVGSNCLRDFLGVDPHTLVKYATFLSEIEDMMNDEDGERYAGSGRREVATEEYLTHVCTMIRTEGWASRSEVGRARPTADRAWQNFYDYGKVENGRPCFTEIEEEDHARAVAAIEWAKAHLGAKVHQSQDATDFEHNMYVAANGDTVPKKGDGVLAYLPVAHARFEEREIERKLRTEKAQEVGATSTHVGQIKDRITVTGTVASVFEHGGDWGTTYITKIEGDDGNIYKWFGSYDLGRGNKVTGKFTVKKHDEYQGVKETVITRPSAVEVLATEDGTEVPFSVGDTVRVTESGREGKVTQVIPNFKTAVVEFGPDEAPLLVKWEDVTPAVTA